MRSRRALLYMPGDDLHKIQKAITLGVDCICLDIEDGVAYNKKDQARDTITNALSNFSFGGAERLVRINPAQSGLAELDIQQIARYNPDGIVLPKVQCPEQIHWISKLITEVENDNKSAPKSIRLFVIIETAKALINLSKISSADDRIDVLIFGAEDLVGDLGARRTKSGLEVLYARSAVIAHAVANNQQAIDMVYLDFLDPIGLQAECQEGVNMGYTGKQVIHPNQVSLVSQAFTPTNEEIANALELMDLYQKNIAAGVGAFAIEGRLIDAPVIKIAENVIARAKAAGLV